jgi:hypothetical protein
MVYSSSTTTVCNEIIVGDDDAEHRPKDGAEDAYKQRDRLRAADEQPRTYQHGQHGRDQAA